MTNRALKIGQLIANAHPADVRLLFQQYGITVEPTGKTILDAYLVYGDPFLYKLLSIANKSVSGFSSVTGLETDKLLANAATLQAKATAEQAAQPSWFDKALNIFSKTGETLAVTSGAWEKISSIFSGNKSVDTGTTGNADAALQTEIYKLQLDAKTAADSNQTKTYLLIGAFVLVLILGFIMYQKSR